jgi:hypothetical protein
MSYLPKNAGGVGGRTNYSSLFQQFRSKLNTEDILSSKSLKKNQLLYVIGCEDMQINTRVLDPDEIYISPDPV